MDSSSSTTLTPREREVISYIQVGLSNQQIAERMEIAKRTVDSHIEHALAKTGAANRQQLANWVLNGTVPPPPDPNRPAPPMTAREHLLAAERMLKAGRVSRAQVHGVCAIAAAVLEGIRQPAYETVRQQLLGIRNQHQAELPSGEQHALTLVEGMLARLIAHISEPEAAMGASRG
jgi:DNA-binding CsgD family transcriptional regulator